MKLKSLLQSALLLSLTSIATLARAEQITCPSVETIRAKVSALDTVTKIKANTFIVYTSGPSLHDNTNDLDWSIGTGPSAVDFNSAYTQGSENVRSVVSLRDPYASKMQHPTYYICYYIGSGTAGINTFALTSGTTQSANTAILGSKLLQK